MKFGTAVKFCMVLVVALGIAWSAWAGIPKLGTTQRASVPQAEVTMVAECQSTATTDYLNASQMISGSPLCCGKPVAERIRCLDGNTSILHYVNGALILALKDLMKDIPEMDPARKNECGVAQGTGLSDDVKSCRTQRETIEAEAGSSTLVGDEQKLQNRKEYMSCLLDQFTALRGDPSNEQTGYLGQLTKIRNCTIEKLKQVDSLTHQVDQCRGDLNKAKLKLRDYQAHCN
jgi:hypothetical protein